MHACFSLLPIFNPLLCNLQSVVTSCFYEVGCIQKIIDCLVLHEYQILLATSLTHKQNSFLHLPYFCPLIIQIYYTIKDDCWSINVASKTIKENLLDVYSPRPHPLHPPSSESDSFLSQLYPRLPDIISRNPF